MAFPQFFVLHSKFNDLNLQFDYQEGTRFHGYIQATGDTVLSPFTKLEVEVSPLSTNDKTLVHLKNCYNNKYWVATSEQDNWIWAEANEPEEDQTKLSCTLFRADFVDSRMVRLFHVNLGKFLSPVNQSNGVVLLGPLKSESQDPNDAFAVIDWSSIVMLPRNLGFKVYKEDKYLTASPEGNINYLKFEADDMWSPAVRQEVSPIEDRRFTIKSIHYNKYWSCAAETKFVLANGDYTPSDINTLFRPETVGDEANVIALRNIGNMYYCKRLLVGSFLSAADANITSLSTLEVTELVTAKYVDVHFRPVDEKINATKVVTLDTQEVINRSSQYDEINVVLKFTWQSSSSTWSSIANGSLTDGTESAISSKIPSVENGNIIYTGDYNGDIVWGKPQFITGSIQVATYTVKRVAPMTKVTVKAMGNRDSWEVPFFYSQSNTVNLDGTKDKFEMEDGHYTGASYSFDNSFEVVVTQLP